MSSPAGIGASTRTLRIHSEAIPLVQGAPVLEPVRLAGREGVNSLFEYELRLKSTTAYIGATSAADFDLDAFLGREISCSIQLDGAGEFRPGAVGTAVDHIGAGVREINALITDAAVLGEVGRAVQYKLTLRPWLHLATLETDCKVFQNKTVVDILDELLADYNYPVEKRLYGLDRADGRLYPVRDYQTQYNESDFAFFERLCQEWGISYHFEHSRGHHRLVLCDAMAAYGENASEAYRQVEFHPPGWKVDAEYLHSFTPEHHLTSGRYTTRDYDYTRPRADLTQTRQEPRPTGLADAEVYHWHHAQAGSHYAQPRAGSHGDTDPQEEARHLALLRMQALRTHGARAQASGNLRGMVPGCTFKLAKHPQARANAEYLILDTSFLIEDVAQEAGDDAKRSQHWQVSVDLAAHPIREPLRPALTYAKPHSPGPQTARVVGPEGQSLWTDEFGRIKVQFPWDRIGQRNEHSSCWVRVSSPWAGNQLGGMQLPRIGQEVIVDFIGGDPDLPICTGRVHNQLNLPPWQLPGQSALSGFRSRELTKEGGNGAGGRSNHLILDDTESKIQAQLKSDHKHSQLSLGHITRIEDNAGRKDERGEGFDLRTDAHGAIRAKDGLYLSAEGREQARSHVLDMGETVSRLTQAHDRHDTLASLAEHHKAQEAGEDQKAVADDLKAQNEEIKGTSEGGKFPELARPHLVASSPAGIETSTGGTTHIASGEHTAITSGAHTSIASARSFFASALDAVCLFAYKAGVRIFAGKGAVQIQAQDDRIELIAKRAIELISESDWIRLKARKGISFEVPGHSFTMTDTKGFEALTGQAFHIWSSDFQTFGPKAPPTALPILPESTCIPCMLKAARAGSPTSAI
ncbi:type VI secretion system Vgr family protein [Variovorax sp. OV329]|uniref:type VI secretion system Vgr family protein n=1 Tax=Variovorax sp. OV329 TaxID=1882825 RepID=UPI0008EC1ABC|nr:type VI secretion system Vgr family protein [Variovorax sp. OV329]SFM41634.1 type VI secretion system secreted protein VgrG [Variovorax sp. OV329]